MDVIPASRCSCGAVTAPPAPYCPQCARPMEPWSLPNIGTLLSYTILHTPPAGFSAPLPIALVELEAGVRFLCHGQEIADLKIGRPVRIEGVDEIYYFSTLTLRERVLLFWRRRGPTPERVKAMGKSLLRRLWIGRG